MALLDWFDTTVGHPARTFATGFSMGGSIAVKLAELYPRRFDGVLVTSPVLDELAQMNRALDITFAVRTLLSEDQTVELVKAKDPDHTVAVLAQAATDALATPEGRARLALAGALGNLPTWDNAHEPMPSDLVERIRQQATFMIAAYISSGPGPRGRADLEQRAGGNPVYNVGVDYARQLTRSSQRALVEQAYAAAPNANLQADLAKLAAAPRIAPDPGATAYVYRWGVPLGSSPTPVLTVHPVGDAGAIADQERWYAEMVARFGHSDRLRQLYVNRGDHGSVSTADEVLALQALSQRAATGTWPDLSARRLNATVATFPPDQQKVLDIITFTDKIMPPAFVDYTPPRALRPSL
jgi:pimeloyl-ACP methyl ester carboxylesterase